MTCLKINRLCSKYSTSLQQNPEAEEPIIQSPRVYRKHEMGDLFKIFIALHFTSQIKFCLSFYLHIEYNVYVMNNILT